MTKQDNQMGQGMEINRRNFLRSSAMFCGWMAIEKQGLAAPEIAALHERPGLSARKFTSPAIEATILRMKRSIADPQLGIMFERCFPNTLDTTVFPGERDGKPDTFVITGDIDAMWLRDSSAQVWPYLPFVKEDPNLGRLIEGIIRRQASQILLDSYANAFLRAPGGERPVWSRHDETEMRPGVAERKWEVDSLCYPVRLAHGFWQKTGSTSPFDEQWHAAAQRIVKTFREQQRKTSPGPYRFQRTSSIPTETLPLGGYGNPARSNGMIFSMFRPSDDACIYPLFVPANLFALKTLGRLEEMATHIFADQALAQECRSLASEVSAALQAHCKVTHPQVGEIWAYEVDGYGSTLCMDDANAPSLLSLPYLECCDLQDPLYQRTRKFVLGRDNPYFFSGPAGEGVGGPHVGLGYVWPMSIIMRAFTSTDEDEILGCLQLLRDTTAGTGFVHESFNVNNPADYTRPWFAWANTLFGELLLKLDAERPALLRQSLKQSSKG
jgi:meiotically up-regulated gene 157 (Mug157) protein